jgi:DNA-binding SARP family transcriptional activator
LLAVTICVDRAPGPMTHAASRRLRDLGVRLPWSGIADPLALVPVSHGVRIQALGVFRVLRHDMVVPPTEWQSKKARDLLKILVSRRGRSVTRDELIALLWPDDHSAKAPNRLSVLLSTLRSVLDGSTEQSPVVSDRSTVRLDLEVLDVDVEHFAGLVNEALDAWHRRRGDAVTLLTQAEAAYGGDFCEEDVFEPWAGPLREELRSLHLAVVRALATASRQAGYTDGAVRWLLVVLRHDPYDESAHLELVRTLTQAGRHGDARRHYDTYVDRMTELAIRPTPFPA